MDDEQQRYEDLLSKFLFGDGETRIRARFVVPSSRPTPRAELPALPATGKIVSITEATPDRVGELRAIEAPDFAMREALRQYQRAAARPFRRHDFFSA